MSCPAASHKHKSVGLNGEIWEGEAGPKALLLSGGRGMDSAFN